MIPGKRQHSWECTVAAARVRLAAGPKGYHRAEQGLLSDKFTWQAFLEEDTSYHLLSKDANACSSPYVFFKYFISSLK